MEENGGLMFYNQYNLNSLLKSKPLKSFRFYDETNRRT